MSRRPTVLGLREAAVSLLAQWRDEAPLPALGGTMRAAVRALVAEVDRAVARAEKDSAADYADGDPREADVARRLGVDPATLRRYRASVRAERASK